VRGQPVVDTGDPIKVPVGPGTLGRIINVIGEPIDERGPIDTERFLPIHREAPTFQEQGSGEDLLITGKFKILVTPANASKVRTTLLMQFCSALFVSLCASLNFNYYTVCRY
jgi:F0F1-type ATP synthase beta subunit